LKGTGEDEDFKNYDPETKEKDNKVSIFYMIVKKFVSGINLTNAFYFIDGNTLIAK
jgi:hypothetical protein